MGTQAFGTKFPDFFAALARPFEDWEIKTRPAQGGRDLRYITARTASNRLDEVCGPENWHDAYVPAENSVTCMLTIRLPDGTEVTKQDAGGYAGMQDQGDDDKSGYSDAFKRACAKWGIGRYLYRDGVPGFVRERYPELDRESRAAHSQPHQHRPAYDAPERRDAPAGPPRPEPPQHREPQGNGNGGGRPGSAPRSGRAMFAWIKEQEQRHGPGLLKQINDWGKLNDFPGRLVDWDGNQVALAHAEAERRIAAMVPRGREPGEEG